MSVNKVKIEKGYRAAYRFLTEEDHKVMLGFGHARKTVGGMVLVPPRHLRTFAKAIRQASKPSPKGKEAVQ